MDLEARVRDLAAAMSSGAAEPFLADRLRVDVDGQPGDRDAANVWLAAAPKNAIAFTVVGIKRNLTFVDWVWPGVGAGVAVLSWDQDGRVVHAMLQRRKR